MFEAIASLFEEVIGVDFSPDMVSHTRNRFWHLDNVEVLLSYGMTFPLELASVDLVYLVLALKYMNREAVESYFSEANRVLHPGGFFRFQTRWDIE